MRLGATCHASSALQVAARHARPCAGHAPRAGLDGPRRLALGAEPDEGHGAAQAGPDAPADDRRREDPRVGGRGCRVRRLVLRQRPVRVDHDVV
eukprot:3112111-Rhodomonas_salina.1